MNNRMCLWNHRGTFQNEEQIRQSNAEERHNSRWGLMLPMLPIGNKHLELLLGVKLPGLKKKHCSCPTWEAEYLFCVYSG